MNHKSLSPERLTPEVESKALQRKAKVELAADHLQHNIYATLPHLFKTFQAATKPEPEVVQYLESQYVNEGPVTNNVDKILKSIAKPEPEIAQYLESQYVNEGPVTNNVDQILKSIEEIHNGHSS
jgi:retron-type reverse transcriptase